MSEEKKNKKRPVRIEDLVTSFGLTRPTLYHWINLYGKFDLKDPLTIIDFVRWLDKQDKLTRRLAKKEAKLYEILQGTL